MQFPNELLRCVLFVGGKNDDDHIEYRGMGFLVLVPHSENGKSFGFAYLVTTRHVVERIGNEVFYVRPNVKVGHTAEDIPLNGERPDRVVWYYHPTDAEADVAVTSFPAPPSLDISYMPSELMITEQKRTELGIGIGSQVFVVVSALKEGSRNMPFVRVGNIAAFPDQKLRVRTSGAECKEVEGFLIDAGVQGGLSGSPVFSMPTSELHVVDEPCVLLTRSAADTGSAMCLIGLLHGNWAGNPEDGVGLEPWRGITWGVNFGISVIIPAYKIVETICAPELTQTRQSKVDDFIKTGNADELRCWKCGAEVCKHGICQTCSACDDCEITDQIRGAEEFTPAHTGEKPNLEAYDRHVGFTKKFSR